MKKYHTLILPRVWLKTKITQIHALAKTRNHCFDQYILYHQHSYTNSAPLQRRILVLGKHIGSKRNEKRSLISWGLRVPIWDNIFHSRVLRLSDLPRCRKRPQNAMCCLEWLERLKCLATGLNASLSFLSTSRRYSRNQSPSRLPFPPMYNFLQ